MDIKDQISRLAGRIAKDENLRAQFQKEPIKAVESLLGVDLPDEMIEKIVQGVKAKLAGDKLAGAVEGLKNLF